MPFSVTQFNKSAQEQEPLGHTSTHDAAAVLRGAAHVAPDAAGAADAADGCSPDDDSGRADDDDDAAKRHARAHSTARLSCGPRGTEEGCPRWCRHG